MVYGCKQEQTTDKAGTQTTNDSATVLAARASDKMLPAKERILLAKRALKAASVQKNTIESRNALNKIALQFYYLKEDREVRRTLELVIEKSASARDSLNIAKAYNTQGNQYINSQLNDSAYFFFLKSEKLLSKLRDSIALGKNYIDKAFVQLYESDYSGCELSCIQALGYYKNSTEWQSQYDAFTLIGISSNELKNYDNALIYHNKALDFVNKYPVISNSKIHYRSSTYNNMGYVYQNLNKNKEAIQNFKNGLAEKELITDNPYVYAALLDNLAYSKFKLKDYSELPDLFYESLKIRKANQLFSGVVASNLHLSQFYSATNDTLKARQTAAEALAVGKTTQITGDVLDALKQLSIVDHTNASKYSKEYITITDSVQSEERKAKDKFARIAYETDEILVEKDKLAEQNRSLLYYFVGTLLIGLLLFVIRSQRAKNRELLLIQAQQKANEEIYSLMISQQETIEESRVKEKKRIAQELHDGVLGRLFGARLNLDSLNKFSDEDSVSSRFNYLSELKNIEQDIREISHDLNREKYVLINNFIAIVNNLLEEQKSSFSPSLTSFIDESIKWDVVSNTLKINLYRILQESLQNINKYANAKNIKITIRKDNESVILDIIDDGAGFDVDTRKKGIGLQNMLSRVAECKGVLDVKSEKGKGTAITVKIPIEKV